MPLSRRKRVVLVDPDDALYQLAKESPNTQVYYLEQTGEIFQSYESVSVYHLLSTILVLNYHNRAYAARMSFYQSKQFQCEVTGKSGLNYFQALDSERQEASILHSRFSQPLKPAVLKAVQWRSFSPIASM
jgi:bromodomain adjacent to zinc finger domain protein 1A